MQIEKCKLKIDGRACEAAVDASIGNFHFAIFNLQFPFSILVAKLFSYLVCQRRAAVASGPCSFLRDLHADAGADAGGAGFDHRARIFDVLHAA